MINQINGTQEDQSEIIDTIISADYEMDLSGNIYKVSSGDYVSCGHLSFLQKIALCRTLNQNANS